MKYSIEQLTLAAHVRTIALDFRRGQRNALFDKWRAEHPGEEREMEDFARELDASKPFAQFIAEALAELESISAIMQNPS